MRPTLRILGIRGVPAAHGGFESFAEALSLHLVARGWRVVVYCQEDGSGALRHEAWQGIERVVIPVATPGTAGTMVFDWRCIDHVLVEARRHGAAAAGLCLTLGYNTAAFCARLKWAGVRNVINMDGIEWRRAKWGVAAKAWFWLNERAGCRVGDHLVADHPEIAAHLATRTAPSRITAIPYGADAVARRDDPAVLLALSKLGLASSGYATLIARPEPENSILEIVQAWSARRRGLLLAVLGRYDDGDAYHRAVRAAAGPEVRFLGALYDRTLVPQLRAHGLLYLHGHQVGGTNPSLVEALGAGNAVLAHDNRFNRWVAGPGAGFFADTAGLDAQLSAVLSDPARLAAMAAASRARHAEAFTQLGVLGEHEALLRGWLPAAAGLAWRG
jgi:glycosyltransferase involved in cell wall biosynthesis